MTRLWKIAEFLSPQPAGDEFPTLDELQAYCRGNVQMLPCVCGDQPAYLFTNEEHNREGLKPNICATAVLYATLRQMQGERSYSNYSTDNPFECLPDSFNDLVVGPALVWIGALPRDQLN